MAPAGWKSVPSAKPCSDRMALGPSSGWQVYFLPGTSTIPSRPAPEMPDLGAQLDNLDRGGRALDRATQRSVRHPDPGGPLLLAGCAPLAPRAGAHLRWVGTLPPGLCPRPPGVPLARHRTGHPRGGGPRARRAEARLAAWQPLLLRPGQPDAGRLRPAGPIPQVLRGLHRPGGAPRHLPRGPAGGPG